MSAVQSAVDISTLASIERRALWLATRIVDFANRERERADDLKVGGHQASSTSLASIMTCLYVVDLDYRDRVSVKPHAAPMLHALEYLLGRLDRSYLRRLRDFGGLQSYPSRTKDPYPVDYSTGSVGLGSVAPLFGALADRYLEHHFERSTGGRFISLLGDAELDEGSIWEAVFEPQVRRLGNVLWIVDLNRQSLDRVVPGIRVRELEGHFRCAGWEVLELKYGRRLREAFAEEGGEILRRRLDEMPNEQYQALFGADEDRIRHVLLDALAPLEADRLSWLLDRYRGRLASLVQDLAGHDLHDVLDALARARETTGRPTVIFAYTIKGYGLPIAGRPHNHAALLTIEQIDHLRAEMGLTVETEWDAFPAHSPEAELLRDARARLERPPAVATPPVAVPRSLGARGASRTSTQEAFGRILLDLARVDDVAGRLVTVSSDVSISTNLGGFINRFGVWFPEDDGSYDPMEDSPVKWRYRPSGQHIELGIAEMNLALLLGQLGLTEETHGVRLFPVGTLYDPFLMRALEGFVYSVYCGARFVLCGTPSGVSLSREGGAHQSLNTPGIGLETPGILYAEPTYARELEWLFLDALERMQGKDGEAVYLRLSTKPIDQSPFEHVLQRLGEDELRSAVLRGGFRIREPLVESEDRVLIVTCGAMTPEALAAAEVLSCDEGVEATVICFSSPGRIYRDWQQSLTRPIRDGSAPSGSYLQRLLRNDELHAPVVTVIDGASHALAWVGSALRTRCVPLGVDRFGQSGSLPDVYAAYGIDAEAIMTAALVALEP